MECLSALSISALFGSIASGASGLFNSVKSCFGSKKKDKNITNNINSHNTNNTEIGRMSITSNDYRHYCTQRNGNKNISK